MPDFPDEPVFFSDARANTVLEKPSGKHLFGTSAIDLISLRLEPGEALPLHPNTRPVIFYISKGKARLGLSEQTCELSAGEGVFIPEELPRSWENPYSEPVVILVIKI